MFVLMLASFPSKLGLGVHDDLRGGGAGRAMLFSSMLGSVCQLADSSRNRTGGAVAWKSLLETSM
jgi:hypothetical protein